MMIADTFALLPWDCPVMVLPDVACLAALTLVVGIMIGPFGGGNEAEWTRYLEKALKAERDRLMAMLNTMEEGVAIIGPDRKIRFMNPSMVRDFGDGAGAYCYEHLCSFKEPCDEVCFT